MEQPFSLKEHFKRLFAYDRHAGLLMLDSILEAGSPEKPVRLMAHVLGAQQVWLQRCKNLSSAGKAIWPDWKADTLRSTMGENANGWLDFLQNLPDNEWGKEIVYRNSQGDSFTNQLPDLLSHIINHGTHHRAQIGQILKTENGLEKLPPTDFILYIREEGRR